MTRQEHYQQCLANGCSPRLAEMFASGTPPMSNSDREFLAGRGGCYEQFKGKLGQGEHYRKVAEAYGQDTTGKVYLSGLAAFPGDPQAWVSGRGDVRRVCEERGWACNGAVTVKGRELPPPDNKYRVADDLVAERAADLIESHAAATSEEATEKARTQLSPNWK